MRILIAFVVLFGVVCALSSALPFPDQEGATGLEFFGQHDVEDIEDGTYRQKRVTCDLLSFTKVNDAACAAHCLTKRYRGGYCNSKKVCVCRR